MRVLVVSAHPDDETLGCGATIAKHVEAGDAVSVLALSDGVSSRIGFTRADMINRRDQARAAAWVLGVEISILDWADQRFDARPILELNRDIEKAIKNTNPDIIYTHSPRDLNTDHALTAKAVITAARPGKSAVKRILAFEVPSSTECLPPASGPGFEPNVFGKIERRHLDKKIEALKCYKDELEDFPHGRSPEGLECLASWRGVMSGYSLAEAFMLIREVI